MFILKNIRPCLIFVPVYTISNFHTLPPQLQLKNIKKSLGLENPPVSF